MRKEKLLERKRNIMRGYRKRPPRYITDEILQQFSEKQLELLKEIINAVKIEQEEQNLFLTLSVDEVMQKDTGRVAVFFPNGIVEMVPEELGASRTMAMNYLKRRE